MTKINLYLRTVDLSSFSSFGDRVESEVGFYVTDGKDHYQKFCERFVVYSRDPKDFYRTFNKLLFLRTRALIESFEKWEELSPSLVDTTRFPEVKIIPKPKKYWTTDDIR